MKMLYEFGYTTSAPFHYKDDFKRVFNAAMEFVSKKSMEESWKPGYICKCVGVFEDYEYTSMTYRFEVYEKETI
jgi:hypothetical protein